MPDLGNSSVFSPIDAQNISGMERMATMNHGGDRRSQDFKSEKSVLNPTNKKAAELLNIGEARRLFGTTSAMQ